jgi:hypothetical protein
MNTAILALIGSISAVQISREPLLSNASPLEVHQSPAYSGHPVDYFVPDFGVSHEIRYTQDNIANAEKTFNHQLATSFDFDKKGNPENPRDYTATPDFGLDVDIKASLGNLALEEGIHGYWSIDEKWANQIPQTGVTNVAKEIKIAESYPGYYQPINPVAPGPINPANASVASTVPVVTTLKAISGGSTAGTIRNPSNIDDTPPT